MKNALLAVAALAAVACGGESRPAESPATPSAPYAVTTTETTTTGATETATRQQPAHNQPAPATAPVTTPQPAVSTPAPAPAAETVTPSTAQNPGVADNTKDATNTKVNDRDRHGAVTPTDQGGGKDRDITAAIRRAVMADGSLSFTAKNVKIVTTGGKVTLRGPVKSDAERSAIEAKAKAAPGVTEVDNQIEVKK